MKKSLLFIIFSTFSIFSYSQSCEDLFISEYVEGWGNNKAIEIFNPTSAAIDLSGYRLVRYPNGTPAPPESQWMVYLSGTIESNRTFVIVIDKTDPNGTGQESPVWDDLQDRADVFLCPDYNVSHTMYFNGDDALALEKLDGSYVDIFGKIGERPLNENGGTSNPVGGWSTIFPHNTGQGTVITRDHTMCRTHDVSEGITTNPEFFDPMAEYDTLPANTFINLNWHESICTTGTNQKPEFSQTSYEFILPPESPAGTTVGNVSASDPDGDLLNYFIVAGNPYHPFLIDRNSGEILVDNPEQITTYPYQITIDVTDGTAPVSVNVTILSGLPLYDVTFNVDMSEAGAFNPETDDVYISGDFAWWPQPGTDPGLMMEPTEENPLIYTLTIDSIPTGNIQYKYFRVINNVPSWNWGEWPGDPNREVYINSNAILNDPWGIILPPEEEIIADFDNINLLNIFEVKGCGNWNNLPVSQTFYEVPNPDPSGINTSSTVMKFLRRGLDESGETDAGFVANNELNVTDYDYLHVMVWKPKISPLKIYTHSFIWEYEAFNLNPQISTGVWEDMVFDLRDFDQDLEYFDFMPDYEDPFTSNELIEIYFDNIRLSNDSVPYSVSIKNFIADETTICQNSSVAFLPDTNNVNIDSVLWQFPGGVPASSNVLFPTVEYPNQGVFDVTLTAWHNGLSNVISKTEYIEVMPLPSAPAHPTGDTMVCYDEIFSNYTTNSTSAIWELTPATAGIQNYYDSTCSIIWDQNFSGEASLKVKIYNGCGEGQFSEPLYIQKLEPSNVEFSASQTVFVTQPYTVQFTNLTPNPDDFGFFWDFGNGGTSTETQPEYTYPENGEYSVSLTTTNINTGCSDTLFKENYIFCSGVGIDGPKDEGFKYWVNYTDRALKIEMPFEYKNSSLKLFDMQGKLCRVIQICQPEMSVPLSGLPAGLYQFVIVGGKRKLSGKIVF